MGTAHLPQLCGEYRERQEWLLMNESQGWRKNSVIPKKARCTNIQQRGWIIELYELFFHYNENLFIFSGMLVVNVTWRNKTYVGTLLDCTRHDWAPPRYWRGVFVWKCVYSKTFQSITISSLLYTGLLIFDYIHRMSLTLKIVTFF